MHGGAQRRGENYQAPPLTNNLTGQNKSYVKYHFHIDIHAQNTYIILVYIKLLTMDIVYHENHGI